MCNRSRSYFRAGLVVLCSQILLLSTLFAQPHPGSTEEPNIPTGQLAEFFLFQKKYNEAIQSYTDLLEKRAGSSYDFRGLVRAYAGADRLADAEVYLKQYISAHPQSSPALYAYGFYFYLREQDVEAEDYLRKALQADSGNSLAMNNLGAVLARKKQFSEAVDSVKKAISLNPRELLFFQNLKMIYETMGLPARFLSEYREHLGDKEPLLAEGYGKTLAVSLRQEGFKLYSQERLGDAIDTFSQMLQIYREIKHKSGEVAALFSLGLLYEETGDLENAKRSYREVLEISPEHIQAKERVKQLP